MPTLWMTKNVLSSLLKLFVAVYLTFLTIVGPVGPTHAWASGQSTIPTPQSLQGCGGALFPGSNPAFEQEVLRLVNQIRLDNGLLPMKQVEGLTNAARFHATDMSEENYFSHTGHDRVNGELVESCSWSDRIHSYYTDWNLIGENIAAGFATPQSVVDGWMNSPGHKQNILSPNNWETGIGYFQGSGSYSYYWAQDFGRRQNVYPVVINGDSESTDDGVLTIHAYGSWEDVRLRIDQKEWSEWQTFTTPLGWQLKAAAGQHTVELEMRDGEKSVTASDSIYLSQNTATPELNALPNALTFYYNPETETVSPGFQTIQPLASGGDPNYIWQVAVNVSWLNVTPGQGSGPENVAIVPSLSSADTNGSSQAIVTVSLRKADGTLLAEKKITVSLAVGTENALFLPLVSGK